MVKSDMYLVQLVYASKVADNFNEKDIVNILETARKHNAKLDISGILCFNSKYFLQCLEGSRSAVNALYRKILNDSRHEEVIMLGYQQIACREFSDWAMGYIPNTCLTRELTLKYSGSANFDPYKMSQESAHGLLIALRESIAAA